MSKLYLVTIKDKQGHTSTFTSVSEKHIEGFLNSLDAGELPHVLWLVGNIFFVDNLASIIIKEEIHG